jgi:hypothetical protein
LTLNWVTAVHGKGHIADCFRKKLYEAYAESFNLKTAEQGRHDDGRNFLLFLIPDLRNVPSQYQVKVKVHRITGPEGPRGGERYSCTLS